MDEWTEEDEVEFRRLNKKRMKLYRYGKKQPKEEEPKKNKVSIPQEIIKATFVPAHISDSGVRFKCSRCGNPTMKPVMFNGQPYCSVCSVKVKK